MIATPLSPTHVPAPSIPRSLPEIAAAYARALSRAATACWTDAQGREHTGLVAYRTGEPGVYEVPSSSHRGQLHRVTCVENRLYCDCAGANHPACMHRAVIRECLRWHTFAVRPQALHAVPANVVAFRPSSTRLDIPSALDALYE